MRALLASFLIVSPLANGDSWLPPVTQIYYSQDASLVVRVDPVESDEKGAHPVAVITRWSPKDSSYHFDRRVSLRNPRCPLCAVITNDARFLVTFDDWSGVGTTENAVVIYDLENGTNHHYRIEDFLPKSIRERFARSSSSVTWRGQPLVETLGHIIRVWLPDETRDNFPLSAPTPDGVSRPDPTPESTGFDVHIEINPAKNKIWLEKNEPAQRTQPQPPAPIPALGDQ